MVVQCCVCHKVRENGKWLKPSEAPNPELCSHGYCPVCAAEAFAEVERWIAQERAKIHGIVAA